jgi:hypothetical protein
MFPNPPILCHGKPFGNFQLPQRPDAPAMPVPL